jgi:general secretion pathway protein M
MKTWWMNLADRERRVLQVGALLLALLAGYVLVWEPLQQSRQDWQRRAEAADASLHWMRAAAGQVLQRRGQAGAIAAPLDDGRSLLARIDGGAREAGLGGALLRVEPIGPDQVRVQFQQAGFDALMGWMEGLALQHGVRVSELSVQRSQGVGQVDARMMLEQAPRR